MHFTKMQGAGNDYVYVDLFDETLPAAPASVARQVSDRRFGIGSDGLVLIERSERANAAMRVFNSDGSQGQMCGNGIRCVALYLYRTGRVRQQQMQIETDAGVLSVELQNVRGRTAEARVNMGPPILQAGAIPTSLPGNPPLNAQLTVAGTNLDVSCVSMGNPHCVVFCDRISDQVVSTLGPLIEAHDVFPERTNVEFCRVSDEHTVQVRIWERGSGETSACGTGACAAVVAGTLQGRLQDFSLVDLPGGRLYVEWPDRGDVFLTGPAVEVFEGNWPDDRQAPVPDDEQVRIFGKTGLLRPREG